MKARGLDHVVLDVSDPARSVHWYQEKLGLEPERFEEWKTGEVLFPSLRIDATTVLDLFPATPTGVNVDHLCLVVEDTDLDEVAASGEFEVLAPPSRLWGAQGWGVGLYIKDPDGHTLELRTYRDEADS
ncbi:MAG: hypothetical protein JJLCMIEE_03018 [Acidimicrobiales bacterium]|nr:MAG: VOC family virulence protein [Actinomycetota bacterium]MBV6509902.1 hypothetical protein [Acidimicrobiales bacterium]RIK03298.1 MAG: VOC family virulence protein [Acidobacteriota bacterium]